MTPVKFTIKCCLHGTHEIVGKWIGTGIVVGLVDFPGDLRVWTVTHHRSGLKFFDATGEEAAAAIAYDLVATGEDWTLSAEELQGKGSGLVREVFARHQGRGVSPGTGKRAIGDRLADVDAAT